MEQFTLSVVLPVTNVSSLLAAAVAECLSLAAQQTVECEIIIADNASSDGTSALADQLAAIHTPVAVIHYSQRRGYRQVVADAWGVARGAYVLLLNIAGPATAADIVRLLPAAPEHAAIFGYRVPPPRHPTASLFTLAAGTRLAPGMRDPALGLALLRSDLRELLVIDGPKALTFAALYAEAERRGLRIAQIAVPGKLARPVPPSLADTATALAYRGTDNPTVSLHPRNAMRIGVMVGAGLWLLRRWRKHP